MESQLADTGCLSRKQMVVSRQGLTCPVLFIQKRLIHFQRGTYGISEASGAHRPSFPSCHKSARHDRPYPDTSPILLSECHGTGVAEYKRVIGYRITILKIILPSHMRFVEQYGRVIESFVGVQHHIRVENEMMATIGKSGNANNRVSGRNVFWERFSVNVAWV